MLKGLLRRAQEVAHKHLPETVRHTGRRLADAVLERAPRSVQERVAPLFRGDDESAPGDQPVATSAPGDQPVAASAPRDQPEAAAGEGAGEPALDFRDTQKRVVLFGYPEDEASNRVAARFEGQGIVFRRQNLHLQPREALQIASMTGVMVPPYVYIHGRFWGGEGEMESLICLDQLQFVIDNQLDLLSPEARRIGKLRESFDDALTADNILFRLERGHILSIDGLDCWFEAGPPPRFFHDGAPRPVEAMSEVAAEIARSAETPDLAIRWLFEPSVGH